MRPNPYDIRKAVAEEARELGNTHIVGGSRPLDKWIVASQCYACTVQRLSQKEGAGSRRRTRKCDQVVPGQALAALRNTRARQVTFRSVERKAHLSELAADEIRSRRARESDREIGIAPRNVKRADTDNQIDLQPGMGLPQRCNGRRDHLVGERLGSG